MGWNDHMDFVEVRCEACGEVDTWEFWNDVAKARYSGELGKYLGLDDSKSGRCPHCGSTEGTETEGEEDLT